MDREAWRAAVHGVAKSRTRLSDWTELNWIQVLFSVLQLLSLWMGKCYAFKLGISVTQLFNQFSSVQSLSRVWLFATIGWHHESQHARPPCPSPTPGVHSYPRPSSQWCHPAISSSVFPFSSCPQSLPASESFPMSQLFTWGGQSIGVSALASFLPKNTQD